MNHSIVMEGKEGEGERKKAIIVNNIAEVLILRRKRKG